MSEQTPAPQPQNEGITATVLNFVKSLSLTQAMIIAGLAILAVPTYAIWVALNDPAILNKFTSNYQEIASDKSPCTIRVFSARGFGSTWSISTGFAYEGSDRWFVSVALDHDPEGQVESYCESLQLIVDYMRRPDAPPPTFPSGEDLIWRYPAQ